MARSRSSGAARPGGGRPLWRAVVVVVCTAVGVVLGGAAAPPARAEDGWTWPLAGAGPASVVRRFDPPATRWSAGHRGVDLAASLGVPVLAVGAGRVSYAGVLAGRGVLVVVHGDLRTTYEPVTASVPVGAVVRAGQQVGALDAGHAGCAAPACLHWGLRRGEEYLDPLGLLRAGPVRLLPPGGGPREQRRAEPLAAPGPAAGGTASGGTEAGGAGAATAAGAGAAAGTSADRTAVAPTAAERVARSLRRLASPEGGLAALGLLAGLRLLRRPDPPPRAPAGTGAPPVLDPPDELALRRAAAPTALADARSSAGPAGRRPRAS